MHRPGKRVQIRAIRLSLADTRTIFLRLLVLVNAEGDRELAGWTKPDDKTEEQFALQVADVKARAFRITVTINGREGESLFGDDESVFASPNLPAYVTAIYMTNRVAYQGVANQNPQNGFELYFDFSKPPLLDASSFVSAPTPNGSYLSAEGSTDAWVAAVVEAVDGVIRNRRTQRRLIHRGFSYDFGLLFLAIPCAIYVCARLSPAVSLWLGKVNPAVSVAAYIYIFFFITYLYRVLFGYTKWAFPALELSDNRDNAIGHRVFWAAILIGVLGNLVWSLVQALQ